MKKIIILTIFTMLCTISKAQEINYGFKVGGNLSNLSGDYPDDPDPEISSDNKSILGVNLGFFLEYGLSRNFSVQPELLVSTQGGKLETKEEYFSNLTNEVERASLTQTTNLTYINLPVMFKYHINDKIDIEFGPQIGYAISAKADLDYEDQNYPEDNESITLDLLSDGSDTFLGQRIEWKESFNRLDYGINLGVSYDFTYKLFAQARYYYGLSTIDDNSTFGVDYNSWDLKNSVIQLSLGYKIN